MLKEYKRLAPYIKRYIPYYLPGLLFLFITNGMQLMLPQFIKRGINLLNQGQTDLSQMGRIAFFMVLVALGVALGRFCWRFFIIGSARKIEKELRDALFFHLLRLSGSFYSTIKTGDIMARATNDMRSIRMALGWALVAFMDGLFMTLATMIILFQNYPRLALITIAPLPVITVVILSLGRLLGGRFKRVQEGFSALSGNVQENLTGIRVIKSFVMEKVVEKKFGQANDQYLQANMELVKIWGAMFPVVTFLSGMTTLLLLRFGGADVLNGTLSPGDFIAILSYLGMLIWPMMGAGFTINLIQRGAASMGRLNEIFASEPDITSPPLAPKIEQTGDLVIKNLSFSYSESADPVLKDINLTLPAGQTMGILGRIGSGKSTLVKLIPRILDPAPGEISLSGRDCRDYNLSSLRSVVGMVPQESFLFSATLEENIAFGDPEASPERIAAAAELSTIDRDVESFPLRWETVVGERGVTLSGGQKQRASLSRALLINPEILILDDALSAVDTETEEKILQGLFRVRKGKTNIFISHRVSTLQSADFIIVLDQGRIIQKGTHQELIAKEGFYQEIYNLQQAETQKDAV